MVERDLPKVDVEGSNPFSRSKNIMAWRSWAIIFFEEVGSSPRRGLGSSDQGESRKKEFFYAEPPERTSKTSQNCRGHKVAHEIGNF